jgi:hypothetical protein
MDPALSFLHGKRPPAELGALLFLDRAVLERDLPWLDDVVRATRPARLPVVRTREEVAAVLRPLTGVPRLMASRLYGPACVCSKVAACASRTSTAPGTRSWSAEARATGTA